MARKRLIDKSIIDCFHTNLKIERTSAGFSQEAFAKEVGLKPVTYASIERGTTQATISHLAVIAGRLNVPTDYLLGISDERRPAYTFHADMVNVLKENQRLKSSLKMISDMAASQT